MYPNLLPLIFFSIAAAFTPGPNNIVGSYSGFNFGIKKSLPLIFFSVAAAFTPGPNNIVGSYSGFNFGIKKSIPLILGVTLGYTTLITLSAAGLNVVFNTYPILKTIIKIIGSLFLIYLAYKISFQNQIEEKKIKNPVTFYDTFISVSYTHLTLPTICSV